MKGEEAGKKKDSTYDLLLKLTKKENAGILINARNNEEVHYILSEWIHVAERLKKENDELRRLLKKFFHIKKTDKEEIKKLEG